METVPGHPPKLGSTPLIPLHVIVLFTVLIDILFLYLGIFELPSSVRDSALSSTVVPVYYVNLGISTIIIIIIICTWVVIYQLFV